MTPIEELDTLLTLIHKYDLPLSPILEYAINEKKEANISNMPVEKENIEDFSDVPESIEETQPTSINIVDFDIPENADTTTRNKYLMQFCYGILTNYKGALTEREKMICYLLFVKNARKRASKEYKLSVERVRQVFVKSIKKISHAHNAAMKELDELRQENDELKRRNHLLELEMVNMANGKNVMSLENIEDKLCYKAKRLLTLPCDDLPLSQRTCNVLKHAHIEYFRDIPQLTIDQIIKFRNCGRKTTTELIDFLKKYSLEFGLTYDEIVSRLVKLFDSDFDNSLFIKQDKRGRYRNDREKEKEVFINLPDDLFDETDELKTSGNMTKIEHVFIETKNGIERTSTLPISKENRSGKAWSPAEEKEMMDYYEAGHSFYAIAKAIGRTEVAVMSRLGHMGIIDYKYGQE